MSIRHIPNVKGYGRITVIRPIETGDIQKKPVDVEYENEIKNICLNCPFAKCNYGNCDYFKEMKEKINAKRKALST